LKIPVIKKLVESHTIEELRGAEDALLEEQTPSISIEGDDEGEQLTHVLAAIQILHTMKHDGVEFTAALRAYTQRVRTSISL
jgi:hypothetical protein